MAQQTALVTLGYDIASVYSTLTNVEAVVMAGSQISENADEESDIDLYVYLRDDLTIEKRAVIAQQRSHHAEVGNQFWEPGDEWVEDDSHISVDVMFRRKQWIEDEIKRVTMMHNASIGYSTCLWYNVLNSQTLYDRSGWYTELKKQANVDYSPALQQAVIRKNYPILRSTLSSYFSQLGKAIKRHDLVSINHRVAALLASYFDILFAVNKQPHPGEKRLIFLAEKLCSDLPADISQDIQAIISRTNVANPEMLDNVSTLLDNLDALLHARGLHPIED